MAHNLQCAGAGGRVALTLPALGFFALAVVGQAEAKIVAEGKLAQYCAEEAVVRLNVARDKLILLPVEKIHGKFHVYGQTDDGPVSLFECTFDGKKAFLGIKIQRGPDEQSQQVPGIPKAAINKCLQMVGVPAKVEKASRLKPGFSEIIIKETASPRRVACTVPDDGSEIEDWVEMK